MNVNSEWADLVARGFFTEFTYEARRRYQKSAQALSPCDRKGWVVEVGCGTGRYHNLLAEMGYENVVSCDLTFEHIKRAKDLNPRGLFVVASGEALPFKDGIFDGLASNASIEHFSDPARGIREFSRVTNDQACLVVTSDCYSWRVMQLLGLYRSKMPIDKAMTYSQFRRMFSGANLAIADADAWGVTHYLRKFARASSSASRWIEVSMQDSHWSNRKPSRYLAMRLRMNVLDENLFVLRKMSPAHERGRPAARAAMTLDDILACPQCHGELRRDHEALECSACRKSYPIVDGIPVFISS